MTDTESSAIDPLERQQLVQTRSELGTFWHRSRSDLVARLLRRSHARSILDVGAGAGHLGSWLEAKGPQIKYQFSEQNPRLDAELRRRFSPAQSVSIDGHRLDVDALALLDVIEHVPDDGAFLASLVNELGKGALLVVTVPAMPSLYSAWDEAMGHHRRYTKRSLRKVMSALPLEVRECSYLFPELWPAALIRRIAKPKTAQMAPEFPLLPNIADRGLYAVSWLTTTLRRIWPFGTSLLLVAARVEDPT